METEFVEAIDDAGNDAFNDPPDALQTQAVDTSPEPVKALARGMGWIDETNFKGDPDKFVDAETYIRKTHDVNQGLRKQVKEITNVIGELKAHNESVYKAEVKRLEAEIADLKQQRRTAIEDGDVERVEKIEQEIDEKRESVVPMRTTTTNPVWDAWVAENDWYNNDKELRAYADEIGKEYDGLPFDKILKFVGRDVKAEFPEKFEKKSSGETTRKPAVSPVESGTRRASGRTKSRADLSPAQRAVMQQFVKLNVMTESEYISDLVKRGEI